MATTSMAMGLVAVGLMVFALLASSPLGWIGLLSPLAAIGAVVTGLVSRKEIRRYGGIGIGRSTLGIVFGSILLIVFAAIVVGFVLVLRALSSIDF